VRGRFRIDRDTTIAGRHGDLARVGEIDPSAQGGVDKGDRVALTHVAERNMPTAAGHNLLAQWPEVQWNRNDTPMGVAYVDPKINLMTPQPRRLDRARRWQKLFRHAPPIVRWG
jgi:hypothetical protein